MMMTFRLSLTDLAKETSTSMNPAFCAAGAMEHYHTALARITSVQGIVYVESFPGFFLANRKKAGLAKCSRF